MRAMFGLVRIAGFLLASLCVATGLIAVLTGKAALTLDARLPVRVSGFPAYAWAGFWICLGALVALWSLRGLAVGRHLTRWQDRLIFGAAFFFALALASATAKMLLAI